MGRSYTLTFPDPLHCRFLNFWTSEPRGGGGGSGGWGSKPCFIPCTSQSTSSAYRFRAAASQTLKSTGPKYAGDPLIADVVRSKTGTKTVKSPEIFALNAGQRAGSAMVIVSDLNPVCEKERLSLCVGCGGQIHDQYILRVAPDLEWHAACLKCQECRQFLDESCTCFVRDGKTYCKRDYVRLFGTKCDKCGSSFSKNDFVMRAKTKIYHIECFRCSACARQLIPGDEFALRDGGSLYYSGSESGSHKSLRGKGPTGPSDGKPTRVRTVLNEKQLHTLRTCYNANPRPDALMKEQLVEMTGLSPRVIRVWFQNKRCKDKKKTIQMKLQMQQEKEGRKLGYGMQGIPMVASSPVRHDSPLNLHGLEVTAYQPPWKALSDFALHSDLDSNGTINTHTPAFQHLVNQMHGYDVGNGGGAGGGPGGGPGGMPPMPGQGGQVPPLGSHMDLSGHHHPDSTDSYVTYLESDDSMQGSP
uniref:Insulin gene enhancer protein ISL-1 n=1 Tax=Anopheles farauti TaxID=69004 RepID=A0A182QA16_9DIPT